MPRPQLSPQLFEQRGPAGEQHQDFGPARELHRKLRADSRGGPGDQHGAAIDRRAGQCHITAAATSAKTALSSTTRAV